MKAFSLTLIGLISLASATFSQVKPVQKALIKTPTVNCEECKSRIENRLLHEYGMSSVKADYRKHTVSVVYYTDRTNIENIKTALANMGYDADDVSADPEAYKKLPRTCQHVAGDKPVRPKG
ncbi:MAG: heavy metal-associated domain-containing protein [Ginsengibacter sp.]